jgi:hypothetical protein
MSLSDHGSDPEEGKHGTVSLVADQLTQMALVVVAVGRLLTMGLLVYSVVEVEVKAVTARGRGTWSLEPFQGDRSDKLGAVFAESV